jgi:hypothetical protein
MDANHPATLFNTTVDRDSNPSAEDHYSTVIRTDLNWTRGKPNSARREHSVQRQAATIINDTG